MDQCLSRRRAAGLLLAAAAALAGSRKPAAAASALPKPAGKVILAVSGKIGTTNDGDAATFDRAMLEEMPQHSFTTKTPWYPEPETFEGVLMSDLLQRLDCSGSNLLAIALNDYSSPIPVDDFARYGVILALKRDGEYMPVRDKGPLFIIYPFDSNSVLKSQKFYSRSAWQVSRLVVS